MPKPRTTAVARRAARRQPAGRIANAAAEEIRYSVHPGVTMVQKWIAELPAKTGRSLPQWIRHIKGSGPADERACRQWLKSEYGLGTNSAWWLVERSLGNDLGLADENAEAYLAACPSYVSALYAGERLPLRPIHDELIRLVLELGEVRVCPCRTIVPIYRRHVFAQIKPVSSKRISLGLALGDEPFTARLVDTGGRAKRDRITHRVSLAALADIDLQVKRWLKEAYFRDA
ncbi:MAG: DUF5655 domain-containing protein [Pirellulaceae bacterium]|nr:DUF5655 domain-containing protein [Pirellulaceae bacterium]